MQSPRDFSMYGAVDLGARQAAAQRRQQAAARSAAAADTGDGEPAGGSAPASAFVFDVTEETFNNDVALRSIESRCGSYVTASPRVSRIV